ncbi:MAG: UDP-N-acetylglucosamine--N-acetylmuramyl-(pentapeptide) pyrophosphoryl-undecaprenol N-acetylglucosamine transferase, partial [Chloroflexi bacterium]|nr:UDP-N-acetylglucosamine--N-acetylmuramyl-(pentapeptide) pyrophosphoryl-undecaprenol N-acetylglucosamine transferase [Chloroflexota bacterium]
VAKLPPELRPYYRSFPYLDDRLAAAFFAADLAVARAGAATLGEFPAVGLPALLVPLPISGGHQYPNAHFLSEHGAATILEDAELSSQLLPTIQSLLQDPDRLKAMSAASRALARPRAAADIATTILDLGQSAFHAAP